MSTTSDTTTDEPTEGAREARPAPRRRRAASRPAGPPPGGAEAASPAAETEAGAEPDAPSAPPAKRSRAKKAPAAARSGTKSTAKTADAPTEPSDADAPAAAPAKRTRAKKAPATPAAQTPPEDPGEQPVTAAPAKRSRAKKVSATFSAPAAATPAELPGAAPAASLMFHAPEPVAPAKRTRAKKTAAAPVDQPAEDRADATVGEPIAAEPDQQADEAAEISEVAEAAERGGSEGTRRRRRRGGRGRRKAGDTAAADASSAPEEPQQADDESDQADAAERAEQGEPDFDTGDTDEGGEGGSSRRRRRRRRSKGGGEDEPRGGAAKARQPGKRTDEITSLKGSTRLEAKKQRRREGREAGRRRPSILTESEFLARREAVERVMVVRELTDRTQIAVLEDGVLVEHYVNRSTGASMIGNVYLGKVQNVLPSMEAAFVDIGRGRNAVLYAGEVNWDAAGLDGQPRRIESALKSGDSVLVQVTKDPIGHKGARLTSQISLPGRFLVYVPRGEMTGISRKLPDTERTRLKSILRDIVPDDAGVIVRTAAEGASEADLTRDVRRLEQQWEEISHGAETASAPALLHGEPDLAIKVVRDIFNEDFHKLVLAGDGAWQTLESYVQGVAPELVERLEKWTGTDEIFHAYRVDEQLAKALDRKVWLPSGGSLVIDRTEAMTVIDVNTGKFTGSGGNLEETVTRNNLEAAEEIVRQLRLRDIGGIIVVDFIDMVLESNRDLVLRRLLECLGRDRTKHQVAEVTSLGLVQMTRKRIGQGLLEVFSEPCEHCNGRGVIVHSEPLEAKATKSEPARVHDAAKSAAASAGAAKVHAAARRAGAGEQDELDADSAADDEPTADAVGPETPVEEPEDAPRRVRAARRRATRAAGSVTPAAARADAAAAADAEEDGVAELV